MIYYLYDNEAGKTTAFPDNLRMLSGDPLLRTYDPSSFAQQAVTFLCLDFNGVTTRHNGLPTQACPSGVRAQINFPSCWDGKNTDSPDHKSHVAFRSGGPDTGDCTDPKFPVTLPRVFMEVYWNTELDAHRDEAMNTTQPYVFSHGDRTGYGYHADFANGWKEGVLQKVVDNCHCNDFGDAQCCADQGLFTLNKDGNCRITDSVDEQTLGTLNKLPGNNPVQEEGIRATAFTDSITPAIISPVYVYTGDSPAQTGSIVSAAVTAAGGAATPTAAPTASSGSSGSEPIDAGASSAATPIAPASASASASESQSEPESATGAPASGSSSGPDGVNNANSGSSSAPSTGSNSGSSSNSASSSGSTDSSSESNANTASGSSSNSSSNSNSESGSSASSASPATHTCGSGNGRGRRIHGSHGSHDSPASGASSQYKRRSLHKARSFGLASHNF